jgi:hypothetical protein
VRSQVQETANKLTLPPNSVVVLTIDNFFPPGSSDTCFTSDKLYLIGTSLSTGKITDFYNQQLGAGWADDSISDTLTWTKKEGRLLQYVSIAYMYKDYTLSSFPAYQGTIINAQKQYSTTYELSIIAITNDTCKG